MTISVAVVSISGARDIRAPGALVPSEKGSMSAGASASSANSPTGQQGKFFRITADEDFRYEVGVGAAATATSTLLVAGVIEYVGPLQGGEVVSVIQK